MNERRCNSGRRQGRWPQAEVAERLLDGEDAGADDPRTAGLAHLLTAAAEPLPGRPEDERAALDAFRQAAVNRPAPGSPAVGVPRRRTVRGRRSVKVLAGGVLAAFALSGVAIAAQTGALPHPFRSRPSVPGPSTAGSPATSVTTSRPSDGRATPSAPGISRTPAGASPQNPSHLPSASHVPVEAGTKGLCEAYAKAAGQGRTLDAPAQARLARAAGGAAAIPSYCAQLTAPNSPPAQPSPPVPTEALSAPEASKSTPPHTDPTAAAAPGAVRHR